MKLSDEVIVKRCLEGDGNAFSLLVAKYQNAVYGLCFHMVGNFTDAQDLTQEAFVKAYLDLARMREPSRFASWLYRITGNVCKMWLRARKGADGLPLGAVVQAEEQFADNGSPEEHAEAEELCLSVREAIDSLSERNRLAVTLYYIDGLSYEEIGDFLGLSESAIKSRLHRARTQLKKELIPMIEENFGKHRLPDDFPEKIKGIIPAKATREQVIEVFGKPERYIWGRETLSEKDLPDRVARGLKYIMDYDNDLGVHVGMGDTVWEVRIESNKDYSYEGRIHLGSSLEDVISFFGEPSETIAGEPICWWYTNRVLYRDIEGKVGRCYIHYKDMGVRMFFLDYRVRAIYLCKPKMTDPNINEKVERIKPGETTTQQAIEAFGEPDLYYGGRGEALSKEDLPDRIAKGLFYSMAYDVGVHFAMYGSDIVGEVRIESNEEYRYEGKIRLGSSLEDAVAFLGEPSETVTGEPVDFDRNRVLYKDIKGETGYCYIHYRDMGIRMFFVGYRLRALYLGIPEPTP
jgi:RNA polymerase sigma-70 factor (ECF subfamily)